MIPTGPLKLQDRLEPILALLQKQEIVESLTHRQQGPALPLVEQLVHRQHEAELQRKLRNLQPADLGHLLEMLPPNKRLAVWAHVEDLQAADTLLELNEIALRHLLAESDTERLMRILRHLDADNLADIADHVEPGILAAVKAGLEAQELHWLEATLNYDDDSVGSLMSRDSLILAGDLSVDEAIIHIRQLGELPEQTDKIFIINAQRILVGEVLLTTLLLQQGSAKLTAIMDANGVKFFPQDAAKDAAYAFERYDLICAPVVDERQRIIGRLTVETIMDFVRERNEEMELAKQGLSVEADLFGAVWQGAQARWLWLAVNLVTAFCATRFISLFSHSIENLVALSALMPIVASIGGNAGQQTAALMIRSLDLGQIQGDNLLLALRKEITVSVINGGIWGSVLGVLAAALYQNVGLGLVMMSAVTLNLMVAAFAGIVTPMLVGKLGRDPAMGTSVILTFITDSMGFLMFLGLATAFLL